MKSKNKHKDPNYKSGITEPEKLALQSRIFQSIRKHNTRKRRIRNFIGIAAVILLFLGIKYQFMTPPTETRSIIDFVNSSKGESKSQSDKIVLILGEGEDLKIDEDITEVQYSSTGQNVTIGKTRDINQNLDESKGPVYNTLIIPYGKRSKLQLSDGSVVWLNSGSKLVYPVVFKGEKREVYVEGEAIFEVTHQKDQPFIVISANQEITVLGTIFGVTNYPDEITVNTVLKSGSVEINYYTNSSLSEPLEKMKITPGTKASFNKNNRSIVSEKVDVNSYFSWREGYLVFKNNNLRFILNRLSRYYNLDVSQAEDILLNETYSGYLNLNENVDEVITSIRETTNVNFKLIDNKIVIH